MNTVNLSKSTELLNHLIRINEPHTIELSNNTTIVKTEETKYFISQKHFRKKDLGFMQKVKRYADKTGIEKKPFKSTDINYFKFNNISDGKYLDVLEIDVNKAYWTIAKQKGYISNEIYKQGLEVNKDVRLISLGALATQKRVFEFLDGEYQHVKDKSNPITRSYFFDVAKHLDILMNEIFSIVGFESIYFYWVDAIFTTHQTQKVVKEFFLDNHLEVKEKEILHMKVKTDKEGLKMAYLSELKNREKDKTNFKIKPFILADKEKKEQMIINKFKKTILEL